YKAVDHGANFAQPGHPAYEQREPDSQVLSYWKPIDELDEFVSASSDADFLDPKSGIASRFDVDNAIDFHLLILLTSNMDGIDKNFIIARNAPTSAEPKPRFFFAPWDYDATFGRNWNAARVEPNAWLTHHLFDRLLANPEYRKKYQTRWTELRKKQFSAETIKQMIDDNVSTLGPASKRNSERWPGAGYYPDNTSFGEDIDQMKTWLDARLDWLDKEFAKKQ
ncbi:MAG TPA: CotH kinase family protein, partial [Verrucomicrobiae bacterium]